MIKLYYSPGACSLSPHIVLRETGLPFQLVMASMKTKKLADGSDYLAINPKGQVPVLEMEDGQRLTEGPVIVQYLADLAPASALVPPSGTLARLRVQEWLNYITTELHKGFSPLFTPGMPEEAKAMFRAKLLERFGWIDGQLAGKTFLTGDTFTAADAYLFTVANWGQWAGVDIAPLASLSAYMGRVAARPAVQEALKAEGLVK